MILNENLYIDKKYVNILSSKLEGFSWKSAKLASCRCPVCGDSKKNKKKCRFYFYELRGGILVKCHNCGFSANLSTLLKEKFQAEYKNYLIEKIRNKNSIKIEKETEIKETEPKTDELLKKCIRIDKLKDSHFAKNYCKMRKIPNDKLSLLYYCENFKEFVADVDPEKNVRDESRLIIPFFNRDGTIRAFQGRSFDKTVKLRYITVRADKSKISIFGLERINPNKPVYVVEGPLDSLFLDNCIALAGSTKQIESTELFSDMVYIFDNEPRNPEICNVIKKHISKGNKVVIFPKEITQKDINDMILSGIQPYRLMTIIRDNTFQGLTANLKFNEWCKL